MSDDRLLRIAQIAPVAGPVSASAASSIEGHVHGLCEQLVADGHGVTLFATRDSRTSAELRGRFAQGYDREDGPWDWQLAESLHAADAFAAAEEFDVIHCHTLYGLPFALRCATPTILTHHSEVGPEVIEAHRERPNVHVVCVSRSQAARLGELRNVHVIHHGIDVDAFPFGDRPLRHLVYLGRMIADKGPEDAVAVARAAGLPIVLAGPADEDFAERITPLLDGRRARWVGPVSPAERNRLLADAAALIFPQRYPEPFGLVMIEAMACGTPVLARPLGAVPELVEPGLTGYAADSVQELAELVPAVLALDRAAVRGRTAERFNLRQMVDRYLETYREATRS